MAQASVIQDSSFGANNSTRLIVQCLQVRELLLNHYLWRHCHSESCKWECHILWLRRLYFIENYFKNCKQRIGLCLDVISKRHHFVFCHRDPPDVERDWEVCRGRSCESELGTTNICQQKNAPLLKGCDPQSLPNLVQQLIVRFRVCAFLPIFPKERASQDMHT